MIDNNSLYESLNELKVVDESLLKDAFNESESSGETLGKILLDRDIISDENLGLLIADILEVPFVRLSKTNINKEILSLIAEDMSRAKSILVFDSTETGVSIAMSDPSDIGTVVLVEKKLKKKAKVFLATERDINFALFAYKENPEEIFKKLIDKNVVSGKEEAPAVEIVDALVSYAYQSRASDVHLEPFKDFVQVRFRIDGVLSDIVRLPNILEEQVVSRIKIMSSLPTDEHASALDGKFTFTVKEVEEVDVRVSILPEIHGERVVMRLLASNMRQFSLTDLGLNEEDIKKVRSTYSKPYGMILATGPTGSGKTTSMYSFMKILNRRNVNIMTIEDPVEYQIRGVNQIQVNPKTNLTFAAGLKSIVRQDPNIILVGEIRDEETAGIAVNAALTGHLVLSTLHTNDAATTLPRMLDMGVEPFLLASSVNVILAQRLVRRICPNCTVSQTLKKDEIKLPCEWKLIEKLLDVRENKVRVYTGKGCEVCGNSGYLGRIGIFEVLMVSDAIKKAIMDKKDAGEVKKIAISEGMTPMIEDGLKKVAVGQTTLDELARAISI